MRVVLYWLVTCATIAALAIGLDAACWIEVR